MCPSIFSQMVFHKFVEGLHVWCDCKKRSHLTHKPKPWLDVRNGQQWSNPKFCDTMHQVGFKLVFLLILVVSCKGHAPPAKAKFIWPQHDTSLHTYLKKIIAVPENICHTLVMQECHSHTWAFGVRKLQSCQTCARKCPILHRGLWVCQWQNLPQGVVQGDLAVSRVYIHHNFVSCWVVGMCGESCTDMPDLCV